MAQAEVVVHSRKADPYAVRAQALLKAKGVSFRTIELATGEAYITIGDWRGTFEELGSLELKGELDGLLTQP